jgi:small subunit ribosomal protein S7e
MDKKQQPTANPLQAELSKIVNDIVPDTRADKKTARPSMVSDVKEFQFSSSDKKNVSALIVYLPYTFVQNNRGLVTKIVNEVQKRKNKHAFVVAKRTVINKKADFKQMIPRNRTMTAVYDALLEDLIFPANIIGRRYRYRLNGTQLGKVYLSDEARPFLEDRVELIAQLYFSLTNRKIVFEFRPEASFIQIPKVRAAKKTQKHKA